MIEKSPQHQLKPFPSRQYFIFALIQIVTGIALSFISFGEYRWVQAFFEPIDQHFSALRTMFSHSSNPTAGKVMLLLWWVVFMPWGVWWAGRFSEWFKPVNPQALKDRVVAVVLGATLLIWGFVYLNAFMDYGYPNSKPSNVLSRADIVPLFLSGGAFTASIWFSIVSLVLVMGIGALISAIRVLLTNILKRK